MFFVFVHVFSCPHCGVNIPAEKIHTHLRYHDCRLFKCYYCNKLHYQRQVLADTRRKVKFAQRNMLMCLRMRNFERDRMCFIVKRCAQYVALVEFFIVASFILIFWGIFLYSGFLSKLLFMWISYLSRGNCSWR